MYKVLWVQRLCTQCTHANKQVLKVVFSSTLLVHIFACLWFHSTALLHDYSYSWIVRSGLEDKTVLEHYVASIYFVMTSLATVGTGDITAVTMPERLCALGIMAFGVALYSNIISFVSFYLLDVTKNNFEKRLILFDHLSKSAKLPTNLHNRMLEYLNSTYLQVKTRWFDSEELLTDLPFFLRSELSLYIYHTLVSKLKFLQDKSPAVVADLATLFKSLTFTSQRQIYEEGAISEELFFLETGRVELRRQGLRFLTYVSGSYFGEMEVLWGWARQDSAWTKQQTGLLVLKKPDLLLILNRYPEIRTEMVEVALLRKSHNDNAYLQARGLTHDPSLSVVHQRRKSIQRQLIVRENNRSKWSSVRLLETRRSSRQLTTQPLVSMQQSFAPAENITVTSLLRRKRREVQNSSQKPGPISSLQHYTAHLGECVQTLSRELKSLERTQVELRKYW